MFDAIASTYDRLNHLLSFSVHKRWRAVAVSHLLSFGPRTLLDLATGTADFAIETAKRDRCIRVDGVDISDKMLAIGEQKIRDGQLTERVHLHKADAEELPFPAEHFDAVSASFGVRNFANLLAGLTEALRVLKPGGHFVILEFSYPRNRVVRFGYDVYARVMIPFIGKIFSRHYRAYRYLNKSTRAFAQYEEFAQILRDVGFAHATYLPLSCGICTLYIARK